jgi:hypothetical protein
LVGVIGLDGDGPFRVRLSPKRHGLLIRARDSCVRIPVQMFTVALVGLPDGAGAPPGGSERNGRLLAQSLYVGSELLRICLADAFVTEGMGCFLLRAAIFDEIGQISIRSLLDCVG